MQDYSVIIGILKLRQQGIPYRTISARYGVGNNAITLIQKRFRACGCSLADLQQMEPDQVTELFYPSEKRRWKKIPEPDFKAVHKRMLEMGKNADLCLLWLEYHHDNPDGYMLSRFYQLYNKYCLEQFGTQKTTMPVERKPGENVYIDWAGDKPAIVECGDDGLQEVHIFVTTVGLSSFLFAELFPDEKIPHFISGVTDALESYGGVPSVLIPDNLKTAVTTHTKDRLELNTVFSDLESFYDVIVLPPPPCKPHGKPTVENGVRTVEKKLVEQLKEKAPYRSFREANEELQRIVSDQNNSHLHRKLSRREVFEQYDRPAMRDFSRYGRFTNSDYKYVQHLQDNYHIFYDGHYYSAPYQYVGKPMILKASGSEIRICDSSNHLVCTHQRSYREFPRYITQDSHMPPAHQYYKELGIRDGDYYRRWAAQYGRYMVLLINRILASSKHEEQMYNSCNGIVHMCSGVPHGTAEEAARRCVESDACRYTYFKTILKEMKNNSSASAVNLPKNSNVRGKEAYK